MSQGKADIGLIGLAVMGQNLVLNMADHGFTVAVYNRTVSKVDEFIKGKQNVTRLEVSEAEFKAGVLPADPQIVVLTPAY